MGEARAWLRWKMVGWREWSGITVRNGLLVTLPVALLLGTLSAFAEAPWPMFQHDLGHTGRSQYVGPAVPNVFWYSYLGSGVFIYGSPVVAEDGSIYGAVEMHGPSGYGGYVFAVNDAGNLEWYLPLGSVLRSTPAIGPDGFLYVASFYPGASDDTLDFYLHKISPDGELVWKREIERDCTPFDRYEYPFSSSPTITPEGLITIVGRERGCLYAFDQSGALLWERDVKADRFQSPAGGKDGLIYVAGFSVGSGHRIFAYDSSGELKRSVGISRIGSDLVVGNSGNIYFADYFYWPEGETQIWVVMPDNTVSPICTVKGRVRRPLAIAGDETIYVVSSDMANSNLWYLTSVDPNGHVNWSVTLGETYGPPTTSVILDSEGNAYVTTTDLLFCFNRIGVMQWQVHAPGYAEGIPAVGADGTLYLYDADATLVAVGENRSPIADAGSDQIASVGWPVKLDGSSSYDPDGDSLSYEWEFVSKPVGSSVTLSNPSSVTTTFIPDKEGEYSIKLTVSDEWGGVSFDTVVVTAEPVESIPELRILFTTNRDGNWEIYSMKPDGSDQINLTHSAAFDVEPWASPDGSRIIFSSDRGCGAGSVRLWLMHYDGTNPVLLTGGTKSWCEPVVHRFAKFFPNQSKVVFTGSLVPGGPPTNRDIYVMDMDASNIINLTKNPAEDQHPAVSPDGTKIAFASNRDGNYDIYIMDIDGSNVRRLTTNPEDDILPEFSPEGDKIIYTSTHNGDDEIYIMKLDGTEKTNLTNNPNGNDAYPVFSPDGRKVAFVSDRDGNWEVYIMNADGSNQARLTYTPQDELEVAFIGMPTVDFVPPALIQNFTASDGENGQSRLAWTNPPDDDLAEVVVRRKTESYPSDHTDGELVYDNAALTPGVAVEYVDTGLANGTTYYYAVFSRDTAGNWNDQVVEGKNADTATPSLENRPPIARASDITGQPTVMYPGVSYAVTAKYFDPDGRDGLKYCYLRLNHPTKPLTMMWYQEDGHAAPWAGEEGENYLTEVNAVTREITDPDTGYEGYEITWLFRINDQWPEVEGAISFGVCALDDNGSSSGWDYLSQGACFIVEVERGNLPPIAFALHYPPNIWGWLLEYLLSGHAPFYETGEEIVFNGFLSMDPDGDIVSYRWDFDDGETASGKLVRHSYDIPGIYNVSLTVEDNEGATDTAIVSVYILPPGEELVEQFKGLVERLIQQAKGILESDIRDGSKKAAEAVDYFLSSIPLDAFDTLFPILCAIIPSNFVKDNPLWGYLIRDLIEQGVSTIEEWQMREVFEALISDPNFSFTKVSDEVAARVSEAVNGLEQARDVVNEIDTLVNTGQLTATEIRAWKKDLAKRMTANVMMGSYFAGQAGLLGTLADIKRIDEASWTLKVGRWLWTASFALSKGIMSVTLSPIVGKAVGLAELTLATASRIEALSSDLQMYLLGHYMLRRAGFLDSMEFPKNFVSAISGNVLRGLGLLRAGESPSTVEGGIESVEKVGKNLYRVTVRNTGSIPARYSLIAMYQKTYTSYELFEGVGRYYELPTYMLYPTDGEGWELAPGASVTVEVELPEEATEFWLNLLGANETGIFGLDSKLKVIQQESWIDVIASWWRGTVGSPVEFGIYDAEGRFTGLKDGVVYEEIPNSIYDEAGRSIWIASGRDFSPLEGLEVVITGTGQGAYDLDLEHSWGVIHAEFSARDIPISTGAMHHYEADWEALASGEPGVTGQIDVDGNGEVDEEIQAGPGLEGIDVQGGEDVAVEFPDQGVGLSLERVLIPGYAFLSICERLPFAPATVVR
ncbi:PD40 domain-containing protein, partial [Candidatus Bipolaricaulota bacterium]|nr:PD40 domain-containing protein [Candidatus Bipolaricaulota bacterium]